MKSVSTVSSLAAVLLLTAACTTAYTIPALTSPFTVDGDRAAAKAAQAAEGSFSEHLRVKYLALSDIEYDESDWADAAYFAQQALSAGGGAVPQPAMVEGDRFLTPDSAVAELQDARNRLVAALDGGAREAFADHASTAQTMFDCWVQEQEENHEPDEIAVCRKGFEEAMAAIVKKPAPAPKPAPAAAEISEPVARDYMVFFDFDKSNVREDAARILVQVRGAIEGIGAKSIVLTGHADLAGPGSYNKALSERRAAKVKAWLVGKGIPAERIKTLGKGESDPRVRTADGVREQENRRVEIRLE